MGIPSYYRTLVRLYPQLTRIRKEPVDWLWMDYNCLIYHCLRRPDLRPYPGESGREEWERDFIQAILAYTKRVVGLVQPTQGVFIGIDGVVPMAKMKQQRLRRFKSAWTATAVPAATAATAAVTEGWNTNAITPGTAFMGLLRRALEKEKWCLSSSDEPGEGEHKVMARLRAQKEPGRHAIYGLDADLVILSLLTQDTLTRKGVSTSLTLFREEVENGGLKRDTDGEEVFQWFSIDALRDILASQVPLRDYCFAMSLLGNDFLPSSLSFKLRDGAHDELLTLLAEKGCPPLLVAADDSISVEGLRSLLQRFSALEETRLTHFLQRKARQAIPPYGVAVGDETWPLAEQAEAFLLDHKRLVPTWRALYRSTFPSSTALYLSGLQWVWDYYRGHEVCANWYYPWALPPLWSELERGVQGPLRPPPIQLALSAISTAEQLCLVLPPSSYHLLPSAKHRTLPVLAPEFFPTHFGFDSVGKHFFWECEAEIPIPSILEVKRLLQRV
jgi:5'-3' exonuclease